VDDVLIDAQLVERPDQWRRLDEIRPRANDVGDGPAHRRSMPPMRKATLAGRRPR
jgi:hypothetical protein